MSEKTGTSIDASLGDVDRELDRYAKLSGRYENLGVLRKISTSAASKTLPPVKSPVQQWKTTVSTPVPSI